MNKQILIIDDDRELCALLQDFLQLEGFDCASIHDGADAIEFCKGNEFGAIILDERAFHECCALAAGDECVYVALRRSARS